MSIHAIGNGHVISYNQGVNIFQMLCSSYSTPSLGRLEACGDDSFATSRQKNTDIYTHRSKYAEICDFCVSGKPVLIRKITGKAKFSFTVSDYIAITDISGKYNNGDTILQLVVKPGTATYNTYPIPDFVYCALVLRNAAEFFANGNTFTFTVQDGCVFFVGGPKYPEFTLNLEKALSLDPDAAKAARIQEWNEFFARTTDFDRVFSETVPMRAELLAAIEAVKVAVKVQQDASGGEIAGYPYHLGYVRDNYGVLRGMLAMGMTDEAVRILKYFNNEYLHTGFVANAQGLGFYGMKHIHENDLVEITGYLTLMLTDCLEHLPESEHKTLILQVLPMMEWAIKSQCSQVIDGMLGFNGDETYIAGGILPRYCMNHGSAEATLLFIEGARRVFSVLDKYGVAFSGDRADYEKTVNTCADLYRKNFIRDGDLICNNPLRETQNLVRMPRFRHGVCEGYCGHFGWTERIHARYICPRCQQKEKESGNPAPLNNTVYNLKSVLLMPPFIHAELIGTDDICEGISAAAHTFDQTGTLPSRPDGSRCLGYDYGLLLCGLCAIGSHDPIAQKLYRLTLAVPDETLVWSEYYENNTQQGTLYRPWESAINIAMLIEYARETRCEKTE